jgi:uncharacterized LabA/DUF88 family protein
VYFDGNYVRSRLLSVKFHPEFNPVTVAQAVRQESLAEQTFWPTRIFFHDALDGDAADAEARRAYFERLRLLPDTHVVEGSVRTDRKGRRHQKGVDVRLAVDALEAAYGGRADAIALVAGDADFAPLADAIRRSGAHVLVLAFEVSLAAELRAAADRVVMLPLPPPKDWPLEKSISATLTAQSSQQAELGIER